MNWSLHELVHRTAYRPVVAEVRHLECLEERVTPSTATVDLTTAGSQGTINGAIYSQSDLSNTGTLETFLKLHTHCSPIERGFNTDARPAPLNDVGGKDTHAIKLSDVPVVTVKGVAYREFVLTINQTPCSPLLSLDQLQIFLGDKGNLNRYNQRTDKLDGLTAVYSMNGRHTHDWVELNDALAHAKGTGSMYLYIPDSNFETTSGQSNPYVYLYSKFGVHDGANGGPECWSVSDTSAPPVTGLSGFVYADNNNNGIKDTGETGIAGVSVTLTDANGNTVGTTMTDQNGAYSFTGLAAGTYTIAKTLTPSGYTDGQVTAGTVNGSTDGSVSGETIFGIALSGGQSGINYNFGEIHTG